MTLLEKYTNAVSARKIRNKSGSRTLINMAVLSQVEGDDIPRLLEIVRVQSTAIDCVMAILEDEKEEDDELHGILLKARLKSNALAEAGSSAEWGEQGN